jgi:hypothetical protein
MEDLSQPVDHDVTWRALAWRQLDVRGVGGIPRHTAGRHSIQRGILELVAGGSSEIDHLHTGSRRVGSISIREFLDGLRAAHIDVLLETWYPPGYWEITGRDLADRGCLGSFWAEHL